MTNKEKTLFVKLCSFMDENKNELSALLQDSASPAVLGQLFFNRMQGVAYGVLLKNNLLGDVNREFRNSLKAAWEQNRLKNKSFFAAVQHLSGVLRGKADKYAMLKGAVLCKKYPEGYRTSNDIDLLLLPEDITEIGSVLSNAGFRQGEIKSGEFVPATRKEIIESRMMRGETVPYILEINLPMLKYLEVDLNFSLDYKNGDIETLKRMLAKAKEIAVKDLKVQTLCEEDFFLHLCGHLHKEAATLPWVQMKRDMSLYKYCDIYMLLYDLSDDAIGRIFTRAEELHMADICAFSILQTAQLFKSVNEAAVKAARRALGGSTDILDIVLSPKDKKLLRYTEPSVLERFFSRDSAALLEEVE